MESVWLVVSDCCGSCGRVCAAFISEESAERWATDPPEHGHGGMGNYCGQRHEVQEHLIEKEGEGGSGESAVHG